MRNRSRVRSADASMNVRVALRHSPRTVRARRALTDLVAIVAAFIAVALTSCSGILPSETLDVVSGSENRTLEPLVDEFERESNIRVNMHYKGSVDMMLEMGGDDFPYDAVWPANSIWISLGDTQRRIRHTRSIMTSPVVFGIRMSEAERLGFVGREVRVADILEAIRADELTFMMTSATQSNSGASGYLGFLYALLGNPDVITMEDLTDEALVADIRDLLGGIHRSSGSSGWLMDLFLESDYDAMVNYEALMIETNQELERQGREPLYVVYPVDGIVIADSPLGYVNRGDEKKEEAFLELQEYLLSDDVQSQIGTYGRRTGFGGVTDNVDPSVFSAAWGLQGDRIFAPIRMPSADVIYESLRLYQSEYRKPSFTVFALDYSGSMEGDGEEQMKEAMRLLLDQSEAQRYLLQAGTEDVFVVLPFSSEVLLDDPYNWTIRGNAQADLDALFRAIDGSEPGGGTNIYKPVMVGLQIMAREENLDDYIPAIILMTDGEHTAPSTYRQLEEAYRKVGLDVPVFSIMFGNAVERELDAIGDLTRARVFDGREDLVGAFRSVKGYN